MDTLMSVVRHGAQLLAGYLVTKGVIDGTMTETVIGICVSVATLGWFFYNKKSSA